VSKFEVNQCARERKEKRRFGVGLRTRVGAICQKVKCLLNLFFFKISPMILNWTGIMGKTKILPGFILGMRCCYNECLLKEDE
jgi:hypothetical protein